MNVYVAYIQYGFTKEMAMVDFDETKLDARIMEFLRQQGLTHFEGTVSEFMSKCEDYNEPYLYIWRSNGAVEVQ